MTSKSDKSENTPKTDKRGTNPNSLANLQKGSKTGGRKLKAVSITMYLQEFAGMSPSELGDRVTAFKKELAELGKSKTTMAEYVAARILMAIINEPDARLSALVFDRVDGKLAKEVIHDWKVKAAEHDVQPDEVRHIFAESLAARIRPTDSGSVGRSPTTN